MHEYTRVARHQVTHCLIGFVAALGLGVSVVTGPGENLQEKNEAAKVANKMDKALGTARQGA
jgi:hypothetical protein